MRAITISSILFFLLCLEAKAQTADSIISYTPYDIELKSTSSQNNTGYYFECFTQKLGTGDQIFISYESSAYTPSVEIKFPSGKIKKFNASSDPTPQSSAFCSFSITAEESGKFEFNFTTTKPKTKGIATIMIAHSKQKMIKINPLWTTCQRLDFILSLSHTNFELIPVVPNPVFPDFGKAVNCDLLNEAPTIIMGLTTVNEPKTYRIAYSRDVSLAESKVMIKNVDEQLKKCMTNDWSIKEADKANINTLEEITYIQKGNYKYEFNTIHKQNNFQNKIVLKTVKAGKDTYNIIIDIF